MTNMHAMIDRLAERVVAALLRTQPAETQVLHGIDSAPKGALDGQGSGPTLQLYATRDSEPVLAWWGARKGWRNAHGRLPFAPRFWCLPTTARPSAPRADTLWPRMMGSK